MKVSVNFDDSYQEEFNGTVTEAIKNSITSAIQGTVLGYNSNFRTKITKEVEEYLATLDLDNLIKKEVDKRVKLLANEIVERTTKKMLRRQ